MSAALKTQRILLAVPFGLAICLVLLWLNLDEKTPVESVDLDLNALVELASELDMELTALHSGISQNYDHLTSLMTQLDRGILDASSSTQSKAAAAIDLSAKLRELHNAFELRTYHTEHFKSDLAVTKNSSAFLSVLLISTPFELPRNSDTDETIQPITKLAALLDDGSFARDHLWMDRFNRQVRILESSVAAGSTNLTLIREHFLILGEYQNRVRRHLAEIRKIDVYGTLVSMQREKASAQRRIDERAAIVRTLLQTTVVVLTLSLLLLLARLQNQQKKLSEDNRQRRTLNTALGKLAQIQNIGIDTAFTLYADVLAEATGCTYVVIGLFDNVEGSSIATRVVLRDGQAVENVKYALSGTPCKNVVKNGFCYVADNVAHEYPDDLMLVDLGVRSYFGRVLFDSADNPIGVVAVMNSTPMVQMEWIKSLLSVFATRISTEIERTQYLSKLSEQNELVTTTMDSIADGVIATDRDGLITRVNPAALRLLDRRRDEIVDKKAGDIIQIRSGASPERSREPVQWCLDTHKTVRMDSQTTLVSSTGSEIAVQISVAPIDNRDGSILGAIVVIHDARKEREFRSELAYQADHDSLTGLYNRAALEQRAEEILTKFRDGDCHSMLFMDLDRFKVVNDTCGHAAGDDLLRKLSAMLKNHIRDRDLLARIGGDEFFVFLQNCNLDNAKLVARKLLDEVARFRFFWRDKEFSISASIGVLSVPNNEYEFSEMMSMVDLACLSAKKSGRNCFSISQPGNTEYSKRQGEMLWIPRLRDALDQARFELYQQPIVDAARSSVAAEFPDNTHVEILLRMRSTDGEMIMPHEFIGPAERYDLMPEIDAWVIDNVLSRISGEVPGTALESAEFVSINLSAQSLADPKLLLSIKSKLSQYGVSPNRLCFEITETNAIADLDNAVRLIQSLKKIGCLFALDDFGSGLSSYSYIKHLPVDFLKLDREFTNELASDDVNRAIVKSVVEVAKDIGMQSIAEGVENEETRAILESLGVDYMQGFLFGQPTSVADKHSTNALLVTGRLRINPDQTIVLENVRTKH